MMVMCSLIARTSFDLHAVGAVYMFVGGGSQWSQYAKLTDVSSSTHSMGAFVDYDSSTGLLAAGSMDGTYLFFMLIVFSIFLQVLCLLLIH